MKRIIWSLVCILGGSVFCSAQNTLYFPHVVNGFQTNGPGWITGFAITNTAMPGTAIASGTITLTQDNGTPWSITYDDGQGGPRATGSSIPFQLAGGQARLIVTRANGSLITGFATVTSNQPVGVAVIFVEFADFGGTRVAEAGVPAATALTRQTVFAITGDGSNTGVAVANPGAATVTITFQVLNASGVMPLPSVNRTLAPRGHTAFFVSELFPSLPEGFIGTMQIISNTPIVATALLFESTGEFATLPVFPLQ